MSDDPEIPKGMRVFLHALTGVDPAAKQEESFHERVDLASRVALAQEVRQMLDEPVELMVGDVVRARFAHSNPRLPYLNECGFAVVIEVLDPLDIMDHFLAAPFESKGMDAEDVCKRFDVVIGLFCDRGHFHTLAADSRYLELHPDFPRGAT